MRGAEEAALAADYFTAPASHVLGARAWGMVAAVLGNMKNRNAFARRFWFGPGPAADRADSGAEAAAEVRGMLAILQQARAEPAGVPPWDEAVAAFRRAEREGRRLAADRQQVADLLAEYTHTQAVVHTAEQRAARAVAEAANARTRPHNRPPSRLQHQPHPARPTSEGKPDTTKCPCGERPARKGLSI